MTPIYLPPGVVEGPEYGTPDWNTARRGRVTASRFADVMTKPRSVPGEVLDKWAPMVSTPRYTITKTGINAGQPKQVAGYSDLVEEVMAQHGEYVFGDTALSYLLEVVAATITQQDRVGGKSAAMERGVDLEADALDAYAAAKFCTVEKGRLLLRESDLVGVTPDGFIEEDEEGPGLAEVKCPEAKRHLQTWLERKLPEEYVEQVQGQLWIAGRNWCDFISYDDRFPSPMRLVIIRVQRDEEMIAALSGKVGAFARRVAATVAQVVDYLRTCSPEEARVVMDALTEPYQERTS